MVWRVASTLMTFDLGCGHCFGIRFTVDLCWFWVFSLLREVDGVRQYARLRKWCMALTSIVQKWLNTLYKLLLISSQYGDVQFNQSYIWGIFQ